MMTCKQVRGFDKSGWVYIFLIYIHFFYTDPNLLGPNSFKIDSFVLHVNTDEGSSNAFAKKVTLPSTFNKVKWRTKASLWCELKKKTIGIP